MDWEVVPQIQIPIGKLGVRIRLYGEDLPPGQLVAWSDATGKEHKGIVPDVLNPGRYYINGQIQGAPSRKTGDSYAEVIELHDPVSIPAGYKGVVTYLSAPMPKKPNEVVVEAGARGVQTETLEPGTYYLNPYAARVCLMDCRSQRYNLKDIGFPTKDGFWVSLEAIIEFRVNPQEASLVYVLFNEDRLNEPLDAQIIEKIILPNARAYTRLRGSNHSGKEFITGHTRAVFQEDFQKQMQHTCAAQGIEIIQALITTIRPPEKIAEPVRRRQIALQQESQYKKEILQQTAEQETGRPEGHRRSEEGRGRRRSGRGRRHRRGHAEAGGGDHRGQQATGASLSRSSRRPRTRRLRCSLRVRPTPTSCGSTTAPRLPAGRRGSKRSEATGPNWPATRCSRSSPRRTNR